MSYKKYAEGLEPGMENFDKVDIRDFASLKTWVEEIINDPSFMKPGSPEQTGAVDGLRNTEEIVSRDHETFVIYTSGTTPTELYDPNSLVEAANYDSNNDVMLVTFKDGTDYSYEFHGGVVEPLDRSGLGRSGAVLNWEYGPSSFVAVLKKKNNSLAD